MRRFDAIQKIMEVVNDEIVVCNLGHPSQELFTIKDRPENFYMLGSMGLASSIGLGIALSKNKKVVVIEGDGAILMNLGSLATVGATQAKNYILIIIDNEAYGSTGFQATFTSKGIHLDQIARACNIEKTLLITEEPDIKNMLKKALSSEGPYCLVIKTERGVGDISIIPHNSITIRDRFMKSIES